MELTDILDFETKKILEIIAVLRRTPKELTLRMLADELSVHVKTVAKYIEKVQKLLIEHGLNGQLKLAVFKRDKLIFTMENPWYLECFRICLIQKVPEVRILEEILHSPSTIKKLSFQLKEGEPQIKKRLTRIRRWLHPLSLTLRRNTFELSGNELQIREFAQQFYQLVSFQQHRLNQYFFNQEVELIFRRIMLFFHMRLNYLEEQQLMMLIFIQLVRIRKKKAVLLEASLEKYCLNSSLFSDFLVHIQQENIQPMPVEESMYLFLAVQSRFSVNFSQRIKEKFIYENHMNKTTAYIEAAKGAEMLKNSFKEHEFLFDKQVYTSLLSFHLYYTMTDYLLYEDVSLLKLLSVTYPASFNKLKRGISKISKENRHFQTITKSQLLFRYFLIFSEMVSPVLLERQKNIYLILDCGPERKKYLTKRIAAHFKNRKNLRFVEGKIYSEYKNADVILTTAIHSFFIDQSLTCPILMISELSMETLLLQLETFLSD